MYVCMYVCKHACMHVCMYVCIYTCTLHICMCICTCMLVCMYVCMYVYTHDCMYACTLVCTCYVFGRPKVPRQSRHHSTTGQHEHVPRTECTAGGHKYATDSALQPQVPSRCSEDDIKRCPDKKTRSRDGGHPSDTRPAEDVDGGRYERTDRISGGHSKDIRRYVEDKRTSGSPKRTYGGLWPSPGAINVLGEI